MVRYRLFIPFAALALSAAADERRYSGIIEARPSAQVPHAPLEAGKKHDVEGRGTLYVPKNWDGKTPLGLIMLLPGTSGDGERMIKGLKPLADAANFAMVSFSPFNGNFEMIDNFFDAYEAGADSTKIAWPLPPWGRDARRMDAGLKDVFSKIPVDKDHVGLLGFSHGASYALSLGTANSELFTTIAAFSPFIIVTEDPLVGGQSIFLTHGTRDRKGTYRRTSCAMVYRLRQFGNHVEFQGFEGDHTIMPDKLRYGIGHFLAGRLPPTAEEQAGTAPLEDHCTKDDG